MTTEDEKRKEEEGKRRGRQKILDRKRGSSEERWAEERMREIREEEEVAVRVRAAVEEMRQQEGWIGAAEAAWLWGTGRSRRRRLTYER